MCVTESREFHSIAVIDRRQSKQLAFPESASSGTRVAINILEDELQRFAATFHVPSR